MIGAYGLGNQPIHGNQAGPAPARANMENAMQAIMRAVPAIIVSAVIAFVVMEHTKPKQQLSFCERLRALQLDGLGLIEDKRGE